MRPDAPNHPNLAPNGHPFYFSIIAKKPVHVSSGGPRLGQVDDLVFALGGEHPRAVGVHIDHGWGNPDEFVPWDRVVDLFEAGIVVKAPDQGGHYPPFQDQPGWILAGRHLMGRTILDIDDRKIEVVNDVILQQQDGVWGLAAVDTSFNGWLRKWGLRFLTGLVSEDLIPWKFVQPLSIEDAASTDTIKLSVAHSQLHDLPKEDLADALEELSGQEQAALFDALEPGKAAETLTEAEPRAQRQLIASLRKERASSILASLSTPQLLDLFTVLPYEDVQEMLALLPGPRQERLTQLMSEKEATAKDFMNAEFLTVEPAADVRGAKERIRASGLDHHGISYLYVTGPDGVLQGVVDARDLLLEPEASTLESLMASPVVCAETDDLREDLTAIFAKYHFRMIPVVDRDDRIKGVVTYNDIMKNSAKA